MTQSTFFTAEKPLPVPAMKELGSSRTDVASRIAATTLDADTRKKGYKLSRQLALLVEARAALEERRDEYKRECEEDRANGHRPHFCIHGVSQWVDYDCACFQCEESDHDPYRNETLIFRMVIAEERVREEAYDKTFDAAAHLAEQGLIEWEEAGKIFKKAGETRTRPWSVI